MIEAADIHVTSKWEAVRIILPLCWTKGSLWADVVSLGAGLTRDTHASLKYPTSSLIDMPALLAAPRQDVRGDGPVLYVRQVACSTHQSV